MDSYVLTQMSRLVAVRQSFFSESFIGTIPFSERPNVIANFTTSEQRYLDLFSMIYSGSFSGAMFTINIPPMPDMSSVIVTAPQERIDNVIIAHTPHEESNCAICQDIIETNGVQLRTCSHIFHDQCIRTWFQTSVKCPVCLHDIREEDPASETSSDESEMTSQPQDQ